MATEDAAVQRFVSELKGMPLHISKQFGPAKKKPILLLLLASKIAHGHRVSRFAFSELADELSGLIQRFGGRDPDGAPHPEQPFYHLGTSSFWNCVTTVPMKKGKRTPNPSQIDYGELTQGVFELLSNAQRREQVVAELLGRWPADERKALRAALAL